MCNFSLVFIYIFVYINLSSYPFINVSILNKKEFQVKFPDKISKSLKISNKYFQIPQIKNDEYFFFINKEIS